MLNNKQAFTLIELIIAIAIISLVAAAVFVSVNPSKRIGKTKDSQRYADLTAISKAVSLYTADYGSLPEDLNAVTLKKGDKVVLCSTLQALSCDGQTHDCLVVDDSNFLGKYLTLPVDPDNVNDQDTGYYMTRDAGDTISFGACSSYDSGANLKVAAVTKAEAFKGVYRSAGPSNTTALATGTSNALTISGNDATFASALATNIGVGDVIQYDSDNSGTVDSLAFIQSRYSSTYYSVVDADGAAPALAIADTDWDIFRAYTSLYNAERGVENTGLDNSLEDFDTWSDGKDLVASDQQWNIALYADAVDTDDVLISGWTTGLENYIKVYTPHLSSEVGASQRHDGKWSTSAYRLEVSGNTANTLEIQENYTQIEGIQVDHQSAAYHGIITNQTDYVTISHGIFKSTGSSTGYVAEFYGGNGGYFYNNIVFANGGAISAAALGLRYSDTSTNVSNNTLYGRNSSDICIREDGMASDPIVKNNIVQNCADGFYGTYHADSDYNISDLAADAPGSNSKNSTSVTFVNEGGGDLHLIVGDTAARDAGVDLSNDSNLSFRDDIDGETRSGTWDIGADEYQ